MDITDKVKTFEDACTVLGISIPEGLPRLLQPDMEDVVPSHIRALMKLEIIARALNEGWTMKWDGTCGYWPYFWLYTKEELDDMGELRRDDLKVIDASDVTVAYAGLACAASGGAWSRSVSNIGSRLALKLRYLAEYMGRQFIDLYKEMLFVGKD